MSGPSGEVGAAGVGGVEGAGGGGVWARREEDRRRGRRRGGRIERSGVMRIKMVSLRAMESAKFWGAEVLVSWKLFGSRDGGLAKHHGRHLRDHVETH
jgi:hypothetical protein